MDTKNLLSIAEEQSEFMAALFLAIHREANLAGNDLIKGLALQGQHWADSLANDLDVHRESLEANHV